MLPSLFSAVLSQDGLTVTLTFNRGSAAGAMLPASDVTGITLVANASEITITASARVSDYVYVLTMEDAQAGPVGVNYAPGNLTDADGDDLDPFNANGGRSAAQYDIGELVSQDVLYSLMQARVDTGYAVTLKPHRSDTYSDPPAKGDLYIEIMEPKRTENILLGPKSDFTASYVLVCYRDASAEDERTIAQKCNEMWSAIRKALGTDVQRGLFPGTSNALARDTDFSSGYSFIPDAATGLEAFLFEFDVNYRTATDDPFNQ